jgi:6-phosphogluconate dehydrogenase
LENLLLDPYFASTMQSTVPAWREVVKFGIERGIALPALSAGLAFFDGYRRASNPANLLQAQRDYFGAHMYQRTDDPTGAFHHTDWTGHGGTTASTTYEV